MVKNSIFAVAVFFIAALFSSCDFSDVKTSSSGKPGEIIIVADSLVLKGEAGIILRDSLGQAFPGVPQYEPVFTTVTIPHANFRNILQAHRNVLMIEIGPVSGNKDYALTFKRDVWATPQLVMNLRAKDASYLQAALLSFTGTIVKQFSDEERFRAAEGLKQLPETEVGTLVQKEMKFFMPLPAEYYIARQKNGYMWLRKETANTSQGFQMLRLPYITDTVFQSNSLIYLRDSLCKANIPGPAAGSYMVTDYNFPVTVESMKIDSCYGVAVRGLWRTEGDFMGGPFVTYAFLDERKQEVVFIDSYTYAPKFDKREYVKSMEAMIFAIRLNDK
jgi:hypothetical protein